MRYLVAAAALVLAGCTVDPAGQAPTVQTSAVTAAAASSAADAPPTPTTTADLTEPPPTASGESTAADVTSRDKLGALLDSLRTADETPDAYERAHYEHHSRHLCEVSGHDPYTGLAFGPDACDVDHIVAAKEAHESGGSQWDVARRNEFGDYALNLVASRDCVNRSKSNHDMHGWSRVGSGVCAGAALTAQGACFWAARTIAVKSDFGLAVDPAERDALTRALRGCPTDIDPAADSATPRRPAPQSAPEATSAPRATAPESNQARCTHDGRGHGYLGYNPGTHTHPTSDHGPHETGKCAGV
ncbi:GmrSD restriction endonuclease domain-containing protein [Candidatus Poriferisodalis sp.]|uniref:GmrSD restriction endonuclease domain-containing protein n=1 Tax=Candidatus Poriferisodalis sp. TaxID=3101277 RepID=UPI003B02333D